MCVINFLSSISAKPLTLNNFLLYIYNTTQYTITGLFFGVVCANFRLSRKYITVANCVFNQAKL